VTRWLTVLLLVLCFGCKAPSPLDAKQGGLIASRVRALGPSTSVEDLEFFEADPVLAVEQLVMQLKPISGRSISIDKQEFHAEEMRVIWTIRALRYLTGMDFDGTTVNRNWDSDRAHFLERTEGNTVKFFGVWMSRDYTFVAPRDAQLQIIAKWKDWAKLQAQKHAYPKEHNIDDWYF
jgi:hypothetical protein